MLHLSDWSLKILIKILMELGACRYCYGLALIKISSNMQVARRAFAKTSIRSYPLNKLEGGGVQDIHLCVLDNGIEDLFVRVSLEMNSKKKRLSRK